MKRDVNLSAAPSEEKLVSMPMVRNSRRVMIQAVSTWAARFMERKTGMHNRQVCAMAPEMPAKAPNQTKMADPCPWKAAAGMQPSSTPPTNHKTHADETFRHVLEMVCLGERSVIDVGALT